ncbi:MAG TPA: OmpH family outer membrane protein [Bacteroidia bacterium]|nr:OmpH family outer membrane protein [Bacteroidia bacterium]
MKKLITAVIAFLLFTAPEFLHAQVKHPASAVAHLDLDSLLDIMPAMKKASDSAQAYYNTLEQTLYTMQDDLNRRLNEYDSLNKTWSPLVKALKEKEIRDAQENLQAFQQNAQNDYANFRAQLVAPIFDQITKAVKEVAIAQGYQYVLDSSKSTGVVLYATKDNDIFDLVRIKLGIPAPPPPKPAGTGGTPGGAPGAVH